MFSDSIIKSLIAGCLLSPLLSCIILILITLVPLTLVKKENLTHKIIKLFFLINLLCSIFLTVIWLKINMPSLIYKIYKIKIFYNYTVNISLFIDKISIIYLLCSSIISNIIVFFSRKYLHRDPSFTRFFIIISFFTFGIALLSLAGTLDIAFAAWEIMGISSFLLIGYFWHRPKAIVAASKAYYIFRICDLGFLAGVLITHFYWHDATTFNNLNNWEMLQSSKHISLGWHWFLSLCLLLPALGKSAQFPFSFWLPKAMEGPTSSSALFYGSLSIHAGVFLLIRTSSIWQSTPGFDYLLASIGIITAISASIFSKVQSNIKGLIGYTSIAQVGIILIELSLGYNNLALVHMVGNTFLRCFQLLTSPSIISTHIQLQYFKRPKNYFKISFLSFMPKKIQYNIFIFALNEGYFEILLKTIFIQPILFISEKIYNIFSKPKLYLLLIILLTIFIDSTMLHIIIIIISLLLSFYALNENKNCIKLITLVLLSYFFCYIDIIYNHNISYKLLYFLFSGLLTSYFLSLYVILYIQKYNNINNFSLYLGLFHYFPKAGSIFILNIFGIIAFPLSSLFFAEDLLLHFSLEKGVLYIIAFHSIFVINGINLIRMSSHILFGKRHRGLQEVKFDFSTLKTALCILIFIIGNWSGYFILT